MKYRSKEEYVYRNLYITMSAKQMADVMWAGFETNAEFTMLFNMNRKEYTRKQSSRFWATIKVHIHPAEIPLFEELTGLVLEIPETVRVNTSASKDRNQISYREAFHDKAGIKDINKLLTLDQLIEHSIEDLKKK